MACWALGNLHNPCLGQIPKATTISITPIEILFVSLFTLMKSYGIAVKDNFKSVTGISYFTFGNVISCINFFSGGGGMIS